MIWWALVGAASWCLVGLAASVVLGRALAWGAAPLAPVASASYERRLQPTVPLPERWERRAEARVEPAEKRRSGRLSA